MASLAISLNGYSQLVAHYDFNGTTNNVLGTGMNGIPLSGWTPTYVAGSATTGSQAISIPNGKYVYVPYDPQLNLTAWTVSAIVDLTGYNINDNRIFERFDPNTGRWNTDFMSMEVYNTKFYGYAAYATPGGAYPPITGGAAAVVPAGTGQWYCLTTTYDGATLTTYVNGVFASSMAWPNNYSFVNKQPVLYIGSQLTNFGMIGSIDDMQIYNGVLSPTQVATACTNFPQQSTTCSDSCYWQVRGNNIIGGNRIFGTMSPDDVEIYTSGNQRGRFTQEGNFDWGINNFSPTAVTNIGVGGNTFSTGVNKSIQIGDGNQLFNNVRRDLVVGLTHTLTNVNPLGAKSDCSIVGGEADSLIDSYQALVFGERNTSKNSTITEIFGNGSIINHSTTVHSAGGRNFIDSSSTVYAEGFANKIIRSNSSQAFGDSNSVYRSKSVFTVGDSNHVVNSLTSITEGYNNNISNSSYSMANGSNNTIINGQGCFLGGRYNLANTVSTANNTANAMFGQDNHIVDSRYSGLVGIANTIATANSSFVAGEQNTAAGNNNIAMGRSNNVQGNDNVAIGKGNIVPGFNNFVFGQGITNNVGNAIGIGINGGTISTTPRGVAIQMQAAGQTANPIYNLEVEALPDASTPTISNIAFHHLPPTANTTYRVVVANTAGELYTYPNNMQTYTSSQGVSVLNNNFSLGDACNGSTSTPFTTDRQINFGFNRNLYFNTNDNGKVFFGNTACQTLATRVEISTIGLTGITNNYTPLGAPSPSGLRFANMKPATTQMIPNQKNGVLSLDDDGDVIWVQASAPGNAPANNGCSVSTGNVQLGEDCNNPAVPGAANLLSDRAIPLSDYNLVFRDGSFNKPGQGYNRIGIGVIGCKPAAKLDVVRNQENQIYDWTNIAISGTNNDAAMPVNPQTGGNGEAIGIYGTSINPTNRVNLGGDFSGTNGQDLTYGVRGVAQTGGKEAYGGWFSACGAQSRNVGVYGEVCRGNGASTDWAGYFNGDTYCPAGIWTSSDKRIKQNVVPISNALSLINKMQPKKYQYNTSVFPGLNLPANTDNYGVIAQDLETILPTLVKETPVPAIDKKGFSNETIKTVNYTQLIPILIQAVKDQQSEIEELKSEKEAYKTALTEKIALLEKSISQLCENGCPGLSKASNTDGQNLKDQLFQSVPNPTDGKAIINYILARDYRNAAITITDLNGKALQTISLKPIAGNGSISVELGEYAAQNYVYTLTVDGKTVDSKKLTVAK